MRIAPSSNSTPAEWLINGDRRWYDKTDGPLGYERYAQLRFIPGPPRPLTELWLLAVAVERLARHTATPDQLYFLIWDGWPDRDTYQNSGAARIDLMENSPYPLRSYYLFEGDSDLFAWEDYSSPPATPRHALPDPAFIWPADHSWCIADDVDPDFATIGGSAVAISDLLADPRIDTEVFDGPR